MYRTCLSSNMHNVATKIQPDIFRNFSYTDFMAAWRSIWLSRVLRGWGCVGICRRKSTSCTLQNCVKTVGKIEHTKLCSQFLKCWFLSLPPSPTNVIYFQTPCGCDFCFKPVSNNVFWWRINGLSNLWSQSQGQQGCVTLRIIRDIVYCDQKNVYDV